VSPSPKPLIPIVIILLLVPILLLLGLNLLLQTPPIKEGIRTTLSSTLGMPISFGWLSATLSGGIKVADISGEHKESNTRFASKSILMAPDYLRLIHGEIVIHDLRINHPVVHSTLVQAVTSPAPSSEPPTGSSQTNLTLSNSLQQTVQPPSHTTPPSPMPLQAQALLSQIPRLTITDAELTLLNAQNLPLVTIEEMSLQGNTTSKNSWQGTLKVHRMTIGRGLILHELTSPIILSPGISTLSLDALSAKMGGGMLAGQFALALLPTAPQYKAHLTLTGASLNQFLLDASLGNIASEGAITGELQLSGIAGDASSMNGDGNLLCTDAVIQPADFLRQIGQILSIQELQMLHLAEGKAVFTIHGGTTQITQLFLRSQNLILAAQGPVKPNGDLDLQARLLFNENLTGRLRGILGPQLSQAPEAGYSQVSFRVYGQPQSPKTDLLERLTGIHFGGNLGGLLQGLFGHPR